MIVGTYDPTMVCQYTHSGGVRNKIYRSQNYLVLDVKSDEILN